MFMGPDLQELTILLCKLYGTNQADTLDAAYKQWMLFSE